MDGEYKSLTGKSLESNILFIGQYNCPPNYFFGEIMFGIITLSTTFKMAAEAFHLQTILR